MLVCNLTTEYEVNWEAVSAIGGWAGVFLALIFQILTTRASNREKVYEEASRRLPDFLHEHPSNTSSYCLALMGQFYRRGLSKRVLEDIITDYYVRVHNLGYWRAREAAEKVVEEAKLMTKRQLKWQARKNRFALWWRGSK